MPNSSINTAELFENLRLELRRGCLIVAVLAQLRTERYGYTLRKALADDGLAIDSSTAEHMNSLPERSLGTSSIADMISLRS